jgi:glutathione S-transferase
MADEVIFYTNPQSRGRIVHWMLEEAGAPYRIEPVSFETNEHKAPAYLAIKAPAYLAINPMGKVPAIVHRGVVVTEVGAILTYLADAFPKAGLAPRLDDSARGTFLRWMFFGQGCLEPALVDRMLDRPVPARTAALGYGSYDATLNALERAVTPGPFVLGERFSAVDVYLCAQIGWGLQTKALEPRPALIAYSARCTERPAYKRFSAQAGTPNA